MKIVIAMDSFKGSMSSMAAGNAAAFGIKRVYPEAEVKVFPLADGGEGSSEVIINAKSAARKNVNVQNPVEKYINAQYGIARNTAIIEMAAAAGITLISDEERNPMNTTTYGVGEMIKDAIDEGCRNFIIGIGGSATNDGGTGMLSALGFEFLDENGSVVPCGAGGLLRINEIKSDNVMKELSECSFQIACDVQNPLCGENGCSAVYGPQKGADDKMVQIMDNAMKHFENVTKKFNPEANGNYLGSGAAGGLGFAFMSYLGGELKSGIELIISQTGLEDEIKTADIVVTGEGRLDAQTCMGKVPVGVAKTAKKYGKSVIAFSGCVTDDAKECNKHGIDAFFSIIKSPCMLEEAIENSEKNLADTAEQVFNIIKFMEEGNYVLKNAMIMTKDFNLEKGNLGVSGGIFTNDISQVKK